jgi:trehalose-phosphatase
MKRPAHPAWFASLQRKLEKPLALFLDFDGTLVPIAPRPEDVRLGAPVRLVIRSLAERVPVVIISGRALGDLRGHVGLHGLTYVGNHGLEIDGPGFRYRMPRAISWRRFLTDLASRLQGDLAGLSGLFVEDKGYTLSVHYRLARKAMRQKAAQALTKRLKILESQGLIRMTGGKAVWEIRPPVEWDKGGAVDWILKQPGFQGRWPLYIGDDETDQDAFRRIRDDGVGIAVGPSHQKSAAHHTVDNPEGVWQLLKWLCDRLASVKPR